MTEATNPVERLETRPGLAELAWFVLATVIGTAAYAIVFAETLPSSADGIGHDYAFYLPRLLAGYFHVLQNGAVVLPWFTPALCGGLPLYADPNVPYLSLPQLLTHYIGPVSAVRWTALVFVAIGAAGMYALTRFRFGVGVLVAVLSAILFALNGMFMARTAVGHLTFHPFMLTPWIALLVLWHIRRWEQVVVAITAAALMFAYAFQSGMVHALPPTILAIAAIILIDAIVFRFRWTPWIIFSGAGILSLVLSAQRLTAASAFLGNFPRDYYPLPGFGSLVDAITTAFRTVFWSISDEAGMERLANTLWAIRDQEWAYSTGPATGFLLLVGLAVLVWKSVRREADWTPIRILMVAGLSFAAFVPIAVNFYEPTWNAFLKSLPFFGSSVLMLRWFAFYIPVAIVLAVLSLDAVPLPHWARTGLAVVAAAVTIGWNVQQGGIVDKGFDATLIEASWETVKTAEDIPPIEFVADEGDHSSLALGMSHLNCYQPMFGYRLEKFPRKGLFAGFALDPAGGGDLNVKNPACYIYPEENACEPGDHFSSSEERIASRFLTYGEIPFRRSNTQAIADLVSPWSLALTLLALLIALPVWGFRSLLAAR